MVLGFDHAQSCLSALFWSEEEAISETCTLKPIPHADYYIQIFPSKFIVALDELDSIRFSWNQTAFATMKLEGILRVTIPSGCRFKGKVITLSPTNEIHFDKGSVISVPMDAARDVELKMIEFATNSSIYKMKSGNPGPSLSEANLMWKDLVDYPKGRLSKVFGSHHTNDESQMLCDLETGQISWFGFEGVGCKMRESGPADNLFTFSRSDVSSSLFMAEICPFAVDNVNLYQHDPIDWFNKKIIVL